MVHRSTPGLWGEAGARPGNSRLRLALVAHTRPTCLKRPGHRIRRMQDLIGFYWISGLRWIPRRIHINSRVRAPLQAECCFLTSLAAPVTPCVSQTSLFTTVGDSFQKFFSSPRMVVGFSWHCPVSCKENIGGLRIKWNMFEYGLSHLSNKWLNPTIRAHVHQLCTFVRW